MGLIYLSIIFFFEYTVWALQGGPDSICFTMARKVRQIPISPTETRTIVQWVSEMECCEGYIQTDDFCKPHCSIPCKFGTCVEPNTCACEENYEGAYCEILVCPAGYRGENCSEECLPSTYGENCLKNCICLNGNCDPIDGMCHCYSGWSGVKCDVSCPIELNCQNGGVCNNISCTCLPGYIGDRCEKTCSEGYWGINCKRKCNCSDDSYKCNPTNGQCEDKCKHGEYFEGYCWCNSGWEGEFCTEKICKKGYYGKKCDQVCSCRDESTKICDRITGECVCEPGWLDHNCSTSCPFMTFGENCNQTCDCQDGRHKGCDPATGACKCVDQWTGKTCTRECKCRHGYCDAGGECVCDAGWQGRYCIQSCDNGYYGDGCTDSCQLYGDEENYICDPVDGPICAPGFIGENCEDHCPKGTYGLLCKHNCSCPYSNNCDIATGQCICELGFYGEKCQTQCPQGFYGLNCAERCVKCLNCRPTDGYCPCQPGWKGMYCQEYCPEQYYDEFKNLCVDKLSLFELGSDGGHPILWYPILMYIAITAVAVTLLIVILRCIQRLRPEKRRRSQGKASEESEPL